MSLSGRRSDGLDPLNLGDVGLDVSLDALGQRDAAGGASDAGTQEADTGDALGRDLDELDVPAVGLYRGADEAEDAFDALSNARRLVALGWGGSRGHGEEW